MNIKALILLGIISICAAAPKPIARRIRIHKSEECEDLCDLEFITDELATLSLGSKRESSGSITPVTPASPVNISPQPQPPTPTIKRARSAQPDDPQQQG